MSGPMQVLIVVDSWQGHTAKLAEKVMEGVRAQGGIVVSRSADGATRADVKAADAFDHGFGRSPTGDDVEDEAVRR